ncbi:MAG: type II toxin-antitoxin system VapC family toxin [Deltaproteobacteria bacterium]|nr:type II toxin-antitoxin system VapC family toxin [Deltaproteobacteria bacterium]
MARRPARPTLRPIIIDTDILIWYFRGNRRAAAALQDIEHRRRWISSITLMELLQGCRSHEELREVQAFVAENVARFLHPGTAASEKAIHLIEHYALPHGLRVADALIAASTLLHRATLLTGNVKHFRCIDGLDLLEFAA